MKSQKKRLLPIFLIFLFAASLSNLKSVYAATTTLKMNPPIMYSPVGESVEIEITVSNAEFLYTWQVNMTFNPNVLKFVNVTEGDFLDRQPEGTLGVQRLTHIDDGWAGFGWSTIGEYVGESGSGTLAIVEFEILAEGDSPLNFETDAELPFHTVLTAQLAPQAPPLFENIPFTSENALFINTVTPPETDFTFSPDLPGINQPITFDASASSATSPLEITEYFWDFGDGTNATVDTPTTEHEYTTGGTFVVSLTVFDNAIYNDTSMPRIWYELYSTKEVTLTLAFARDVAVTGVAASKAEVNIGDTLPINVTVMNQGTESADFTVTLYYGTNEIDIEQVSDLASGEEKTLLFNWDTTGVAEGIYQIKAVASTLEGESSVEDNQFVDGTVTVKTAYEPFPTTLVIGGVIGVIAVILIILLYMRRRGSQAT